MQKSSILNLGLVGTSPFAEGAHLVPLAGHPQARIMAVCGRKRARAEELAARYAIPSVYTDYNELVRDPEVDAVIIVTPDDQHYPMSMAALAAGKHVFCEKALAMNASQAREMFETAERLGVVHMTHFTFRAHPAFQAFEQHAKQGYAGKLLFGHADFLAGFARGHEYQWRADRKHSNGMVADLGAHIFDMARLVFGEVTAVSARTAVYYEKDGHDGGPLDQVNDTAAVLLEFASGAQVTCRLSTAAHTGSRVAEIRLDAHGMGGVLDLDLPLFSPDPARLRAAQAQGEPLHDLPIPEAFWYGVEPSLGPAARFAALQSSAPVGVRRFVEAVLEGTQAGPSFYDGWQAQRIIDAAIQSAQTWAWVGIT